MYYIDYEIKVLSTQEAIRRRPEMYVGKLDDPALLNRLIQEALCLAIDEAVSGYCAQVRVSVSPDCSVTVRHNGRGLSMTPTAAGYIPAEAQFTKLYACRNNKANPRLKRSCCGIGVTVVNALSECFCVRNFHEGACWIQEYRCGEPLAPFRSEMETEETGLELSFSPDSSLLSGLHFDARKLVRWVQSMEAGFVPPTIKKGRRKSGEPVVLLFETLNSVPRLPLKMEK